MNEKNRNEKNKDEWLEELAAWLAGALEPKEAAAFEQRLKENDDLRAEAEAMRRVLAGARDWMLEEPPGAERAERLPIPTLAPAVIAINKPRGGGRLSERRHFWQGLTAAAIFIIGFLLGHLAPRMGGPEPQTVPTQLVQSANVSPAARQRAEAPTSDNHEKGNEAPSVSEPPRPVRTAREENGKVIIETTLRGSGARALWVIDGGFQIANNSNTNGR